MQMTEQRTRPRAGTVERSQTRVEVRSLRKAFGSGAAAVHALDGIDLTVAAGEMVVLLGPSGCGKTTLLRSIAGLERPDAGEIWIDERCVYSATRRIFLPPEARDLGMVFQSYALWPHMNVRENVAYPLRCRRVPKRDISDRVDAVLAAVRLHGLGDRMPAQLSGGQQQRVSLARAIVANPGVILFDEPLSNVDAKVREQLRLELLAMQDRLGFAAIFVTHDQTEAMILGDMIAVLGRGKVAQIGAPRDIYARPANQYVADFIGSANKLPVFASSKRANGGGTEFDSPLGPLVTTHEQPELDGDGPAVAIWRPEQFSISVGPEAPQKENCWQGVVTARLFLGSHEEIVIDVDGTQLTVWTTEALDLDARGQRVWVHVDPKNLRILNA